MKKLIHYKSPLKGLRGLITFAAILLLQSSEATAQSWQWAKQMGGNIAGLNTEDSRDEVLGMQVDKRGNSYILFRTCTDLLNPNKIQIDGNDINRKYGGRDFVLASLDCSGKFRWAKAFGSSSNVDRAYSLKIDTLGGVYVSAYFSIENDSAYIDIDTMLKPKPVMLPASPKSIYHGLVLIKYDSSGNYKWLRMPEPDTLASPFRNSYSYTMDVSPNGKISLLTMLRTTGAFASGAYIVPASTPLPALHILQYDANGNFIKGIPMSISGTSTLSMGYLRMAWDWRNDVYYLGAIKVIGEPGLSFGATTQTGSNLLAKYNNTGSMVWAKQSSSTASQGLALTPVLDINGENVYLSLSERVGSSFNGFSVVNTYTTAIGLAALLKINSAGTLQWGINVNAKVGSGGVGAAYAPNNNVAFFIATLGEAGVGTKKIIGSGSSAGVIQLVVEASTGVVKSFDTLMGNNLANPNAFCADAHGNFYSAYSYDVNLKVGATTLGKYGGYTDIGFVKFGEASCAPIPTSLVNEHSITNVKVYPNPAFNTLNIDGATKGSTVSLFNIIGQQVYTGKIENTQQQISLHGMEEGMYLLQLKTAEGDVYSTKIMKQ